MSFYGKGFHRGKYMKKLLLALLLLVAPAAFAQSAAEPVLPGFLTTTGCPGGASTCYLASGAIPSSVTNSAGSITTGGTFQTIAAANTARKTLDFVNICNVAGNCNATTDVCYLYFGTLGSATTANSIPVSAGQEYIRSTGTIPSAAINATCTATGDKFYLQTQ